MSVMGGSLPGGNRLNLLMRMHPLVFHPCEDMSHLLLGT
jgi:hypothetical protein